MSTAAGSTVGGARATGGVRTAGAPGRVGTGGSATGGLAATGGVTAGPYIRAVSAGYFHTCAVRDDLAVLCWGDNSLGELGTCDVTTSLVPVAVSGNDRYVTVAAGYYSTCAVRNGGGAWCWGDNASGQLGNGTTTTSCTPAAVANLAATQIVATGGHHACALLEGGTLRCWGNNARGQLGDGTTTASLAPVDVVNQEGPAIALATGYSHSCAVLGGGTVVCWGANDRSQLGDGTAEDRGVPVTVGGVQRATAVGAGFAHGCVLLEGGAVQCWGSNSVGQIGSGPYAYSRPPTVVTELTEPARAIAVGYFQSCAVLVSGTVRCWGAAPVGDGTNFDRTSPANVLGVSMGVGVSGGYEHACAWLDQGREIRCWGRGYEGELGDGNTTRSLVPVTAIGW